MYSLKVTERFPGEFQYEIRCDGTTTIMAEFDPDMPGFTPMTETRAYEAGNILLNRVIEGDLEEIKKLKSIRDAQDQSKPGASDMIHFFNSQIQLFETRLQPEEIGTGEEVREFIQIQIDTLNSQLNTNSLSDNVKGYIRSQIAVLESQL